MQTNTLPAFDMSDNTTGCCPRFNPDGWDGAELQFRDKTFVRAKTLSVMHIPINMGKVFSRVLGRIEAADAMGKDDFVVLSRDLSAFESEHLFAVSKSIPDEEMTTLSGNFVTKVFEGPYQKAKDWYQEMVDLMRARGQDPGDIWFFYTTCPKCAKAYGKNYVVGFAKV